MLPNDEKFVRSMRMTQPALMVTALLCLGCAALLPSLVEWWMEETNAKSAFVATDQFRKTVTDFIPDGEAQKQLREIIIADIDAQDKMYKLLKIFMTLMLVGPLVVIFVASLNDYRIYKRFLNIIENTG